MIAWWWIGAAFAERPEVAGLDAWVADPGLATPGWVVRQKSWAATPEGCLPVRVADASRGQLEVQACTKAFEGASMACFMSVGVADGWSWGGPRCYTTTADGRPGPASAGTFCDRPQRFLLVEADDITAAWRPAVSLQARITQPMIEARPCDAASLKALTKRARKEAGKDAEAMAGWLKARDVVDAHRHCDISNGLEVEPVGPASSRGGRSVDPTPVDCRQACPDNPTQAALEALTADLEGALFVGAAAEGPRLYATATACREAPKPIFAWPGVVCEDFDAMMRAADSP